MIRDSSNVVIDSDFTYEFADQTCDSSSGSFAAAKAMVSITTTEHTDSAGDTVYLTHFDGGANDNLSQCVVNPSAFIDSFDPAGDLEASNTV